MGSSFLRGGILATEGSLGSTPKDCATGPSQIMLIHSICIAFNGV